MLDIKQLPRREESKEEDTWRLEDLYETDVDWDQEYDQLESLIVELKQYESIVGAKAEHMYDYLLLAQKADLLLDRLIVYANQRLHQDMGNGCYQGYVSKAQAIAARLQAAEAFFEPALLSIPNTQLETYLTEHKPLASYRILIQNILRKKDHTLGAAEEALLAQSQEMASAAEDIFLLFHNADLKFGTITGEDGKTAELTHGNYICFMQSKDRSVRKEAFETLYQSYDKYRNTLAASFLANIKKAAFYAKARKYSSALAASLDNSQIPVCVYENLINTVRSYLPFMYRYVEVRKKMLAVEKLHMYDVYAPLVKDNESKFTFEEAKRLVKAGLAPLGEDYLAHLQEGFDHRWIDKYENQGKRSGAYSWGAYGTHPYVLMNYQGNLNDVFTLAHEMGHALHTWYSNHNQPYVYASYRIFVAEVASTCNESLLMHDMLKKSSSQQEKAYLLNHFIDQFKGTLFRQTMFAEFEKNVHEMYAQGQPLTAETLSDLYLELNQDYFGPQMVSDPQIALEWARIPHFYHEFYVYQYATGFSAAIALSKRILEEGEAAVADYMKFLKGGSSQDPIALLKLAGVDLSIPKPIEEAMHLFGSLVEQLEEYCETK